MDLVWWIWGIRAGARNITFHYDRNGADTIRKLVTHWAPPSETTPPATSALSRAAVASIPTRSWCSTSMST